MRKIKAFLEHDKTVTKFSKKKELLDQIVLCSIAMIGSLLMSIMNIIQRSYLMLVFTGASTIIMLIAIIIGHLTKKSMLLKMSFATLFFVIFSYYAIIGGNDGFAALWMILAPYVLLIAVDFKIGFACSTGYLIVLIAICFWLVFQCCTALILHLQFFVQFVLEITNTNLLKIRRNLSASVPMIYRQVY